MSRIKRGVAAIIYNRDHNSVLLLKRGPECRNEVGRWENPGGQLEPTMSSEERACQKVREELGIEVEIVRKLFTQASQPDDTATIWEIDVFEAGIIRGKPQVMEPEFCSEVRWFPLSELGDLKLASYTRKDFVRLGLVSELPVVNKGVALIIFNETGDSVLLLKRGPECRNEVGRWENPGGSLESGESPEEAIHRELKEELGVTVTIDQLLFHDESEADEANIIWSISVYKGSIASGSPAPQEPDRCSEIKWYRTSELSVVDLTTYTHRDFIRLGFIR